MSGPAPMSILEQAEFVDYLTQRCVLKTGVREGDTAAETLMSLSADETESLRAIAQRLHRMAPHEDSIRKMVTDK